VLAEKQGGPCLAAREIDSQILGQAKCDQRKTDRGGWIERAMQNSRGIGVQEVAQVGV